MCLKAQKMNDSKLLQLFITLEKKEMNSLAASWNKKQACEGVKGPYIYRLFDYLRKNYEREDKLTEDLVYKYIYPDRPFKKRDLTLLASDAHKVLEKYIIDLQLKYEERENPLRKQIILIRYLKRQLSHAAQEDLPQTALFNRYYRQIEALYEKLQNTPKKEWADYLDMYMISQILYYNPDFRRFDNGKITLNTLLNALDKFIYISKLKHGSEIIMRRRVIDEDIDVHLLREVRQMGSIINESNDKLIEIHERYYDLVTQETYQEAEFTALRDFVFECITDITSSEMTIALGLLSNYGSWAVRYKHHVATINYEIYRFGFTNDLFTDQGMIPPHLLINYCFYCAKMGKHYEIPAILNRHLKQVKENQQDTTGDLCLAYRDFGLKKYKEIFTRFLTPGPNLFPFFFTYRSLKIKCIYELKEYIGEGGKYYDPSQETANYINTIRERNYTPTVKTANINFAEFVAAMDSRKHSRRQLKEMLDGYETVVYYDWLKTKLEEY